MAAPSAARITHLAGKLCQDPTDLSTAYPHGGTALGIVRAGEWRFSLRTFAVTAEERGSSPVRAYYTGESGVLAVVARELDNDMLTALFVGASAGGTTGRTGVDVDVETASTRAGQEITDMKILFSPIAKTDHAIYLPRAVPMVDEAAKVNLRVNADVGVLCLFMATPDDQGRSAIVRPIQDITL